MDFIILYWILVVIMLLGAVGELIPGMPGASIILGAILVWSLATQFAGIGWPIVAVFAILILSAAVEFIAAYWGAKQFGASKWGQFGAIVGLVVGFLGLLPALPFGGPIWVYWLVRLLGRLLVNIYLVSRSRENLNFKSLLRLASVQWLVR